LRTAASNNDARALVAHRERNRAPETTIAARDKRDLAIE